MASKQRLTPESKLIKELANTGFSREDVQAEVNRTFPKVTQQQFSQYWWYHNIGTKKAPVQKPVQEKTLTKDKAWNDVVAIVNENGRLMIENAALKLQLKGKDRVIQDKDLIIERLNQEKLDSVNYKLGVSNGTINPPIQSEV